MTRMEDEAKSCYRIRYEGLCYKEVLAEAEEGFRGMDRLQGELLPSTGYALLEILSVSAEEAPAGAAPPETPGVWLVSRDPLRGRGSRPRGEGVLVRGEGVRRDGRVGRRGQVRRGGVLRLPGLRRGGAGAGGGPLARRGDPLPDGQNPRGMIKKC